MIIINLKGGLGNQMFQYAFGRSYSLRHDVEMALDISGYPKQDLRAYSLSHFNIKENLVRDEDLARIKNPFGIVSKAVRYFKFKFLRQFHLDYSDKVFNTRRDNYYFDGFFQSEKYFADIRSILLREFTLLSPLKPAAVEMAAKIEETAMPVSLHIRRGDYVNDTKTNSVHGVCDLGYYDKAIETITNGFPEATFFIFSDDIEWAKENLHTGFPVVFVSKPQIPDYEELHLMSLCKHHIIANSSFSWWGAWLNQNPDKIVIAPKKWTNHKKDQHPNIIPTTWTRL